MRGREEGGNKEEEREAARKFISSWRQENGAHLSREREGGRRRRRGRSRSHFRHSIFLSLRKSSFCFSLEGEKGRIARGGDLPFVLRDRAKKGDLGKGVEIERHFLPLFTTGICCGGQNFSSCTF